MKVFKVKKNNEYIGTAKANTQVIKELLFVGALSVGITSTAAGATGVYRVPTAIETNIDFSNTYQVLYDVQMGDTLTGIICSYETDPDRIKAIKKEICNINNIEYDYQIKDMETITLVGVPEEKLDYFGYTLGNDIINEIETRYEFVKIYKDSIIRNEDNDTQMMAFDLVYDFISQYMESGRYIEDGTQERVLNKLVLLCNTIEEYSNNQYIQEETPIKIRVK